MCLNITKEDKINFTWFKPITVYKVVDGNKYTGFRTPYMNIKIKIGKRYFSKLCRFNYRSGISEIRDGLHSITSLDEAISFKWPNQTIIKCVVPRFTWYYIGRFGEMNSIASSSLKYVKIIE